MALKPQPPNPKPRRLTPCHRHPNLPSTTTGLCAACLHERLSLLTPSSSSGDTSLAGDLATLPELRRCKTFSANNNGEISAVFEPRRRSCDVRGARNNSLSSLFHKEDDHGEGESNLESRNLGFPLPPQLKEEEEEEIESDVEEGNKVLVSDLPNVGEFEDGKTMKEFIDLELESNNKNIHNNRKDFKEIAGSFWVAASVFSKKVRKWRKKNSRRTDRTDGDFNDGNGLGEMRLENLRGRRLMRETQSEVGEYGFGRRSCDTDPRGSIDLGRASIDCGGFGFGYGRRSCDSDPRFSIDLGRASVDCGRISVDEGGGGGRSSFDAPRASWDGYLIGGGGRSLPRSNAPPPVVSVIENAMATVYGFDHRVLADKMVKIENGVRKDECLRQKKGFNRCNSLKREMVGVKEDGELAKSLSNNARVSPTAIGIFNGTKLLITEKELNEWRLNSHSHSHSQSLKDDDNSSERSFETASKDLASVSSSSNGGSSKKCRQWSKLWSIWGMLNRRKTDRYDHEEEKVESRGNVVAECLDADNTATRNGNGGAGSAGPEKLVRSHSSTSSRGSSSTVVVGSATSRTESRAIARRKQEDVVLEKSRSARYSPNHLDHGMLRFYLTPSRGRRRSKLGKSRLKNSHSLARSVLRL